MAQRITPGVAINGMPADHYNDTIDVVEWWKTRGPGGLAFVPSPQTAAAPAWVRNDSGAAVDRFNALAVSGLVITPAERFDAYAYDWVLAGDTPGVGDTALVVTLEAIPAGKIGRCAVSGVVPVQVDRADASMQWAAIENGNAAYLRGCWANGAARILYQPAGTGLEWCLVSLGQPQTKRLAEVTLTATLANTAATVAGTVDTYRETVGVEPVPPATAVTLRNMPASTNYSFSGASGAQGLAYFLGGTLAATEWQLLNLECP